MNAIDILTYGDGEVRGAIEAFPPSEWEAPGVVGEWSGRDVIGHLGSYEAFLLEVLHEAKGGSGPTPRLDQLREVGPEKFNDLQYPGWAGRPVEDLITECSDAYDEVMELVRGLPADFLARRGTMPWYGTEYSLDDLFVYQYYGHKREHCAQLAVFADAVAQRATSTP